MLGITMALVSWTMDYASAKSLQGKTTEPTMHCRSHWGSDVFIFLFYACFILSLQSPTFTFCSSSCFPLSTHFSLLPAMFMPFILVSSFHPLCPSLPPSLLQPINGFMGSWRGTSPCSTWPGFHIPWYSSCSPPSSVTWSLLKLSVCTPFLLMPVFSCFSVLVCFWATRKMNVFVLGGSFEMKMYQYG